MQVLANAMVAIIPNTECHQINIFCTLNLYTMLYVSFISMDMENKKRNLQILQKEIKGLEYFTPYKL